MRGTAHRALAAVAASVAFGALASSGALANASKHRGGSNEPSTLSSPQLWATVDVCKTATQPVVGIRGSIPADGHPHDLMYMRFGIQYLDTATGKWTYLSKGAETSYTEIGSANVTRQAGKSFYLKSPPAGESYEVRGIVEFEWQRDGKVVLSASRETTAGHHATVLHAEPAGFSAAICKVE